MVLFFKIAGTSPETILLASPSTTAVLPTPASPISTGLFFVFLHKISIILSISESLPMIGSILPCFALRVKSLPISSNSSGRSLTILSLFVVFSSLPLMFPTWTKPSVSNELPEFVIMPIALFLISRMFNFKTPAKMLMAKLSSWLRSATRICSLEIYALWVFFATLFAIISISLTLGVSSTTFEGIPPVVYLFKISCTISLVTRQACNNLFDLLSTFVKAYKICSVPTWLVLCEANCEATWTTLFAKSVKLYILFSF